MATEVRAEETALQVEPTKAKKRLNIPWKEFGKFAIALLLVYFFFFGFLVNTGDATVQQDPGNKLLFVYTAWFNTDTLNLYGIYFPDTISTAINSIPCWISFFIIFAIGIYQAYREDFVVYAIKNNILMVGCIILLSWFWYAFNYSDLNFFQVIWIYFTNIHGYLNIFALLFVYVSAGLIGAALKSNKYQKALHIEEAALMKEAESE
jgi:hypothetical protein